jgi:hypothetical protein
MPKFSFHTSDISVNKIDRHYKFEILILCRICIIDIRIEIIDGSHNVL